MKKSFVDGSRLLKAYDYITGEFNDIFDAKLLTVALTALIGFCCLFTQRKFPLRWMYFILFGMVLLVFVTLTARVSGQERTHYSKVMCVLWFGLHGMMIVSGLFYEDWLSESVPLLICYPIVFSVFSSRDDDDTFRCILRGVLCGTMPFLLWTWISKPLIWGYPGYRGVFYDANTLSMCCIASATSAALLSYVDFCEKKLSAGILCLGCCIGGTVTLVFTMSRSGLLAFAIVIIVLSGSLLAGRPYKPRILAAALIALILVFLYLGVEFTREKIHEAAVEDYNLSVYNHDTFGNPIAIPKPSERTVTMDDLTSDRWGIWKAVLQNLTWNGHRSSVVEEWVAEDGAGDRRFNAHNAFLGVAYNNGWIAGILLLVYVATALIRSYKYYWKRRMVSPLAATPLVFCSIFILIGIFESVYAPFSLIGCCFLLVQAPLWRAGEDA